MASKRRRTGGGPGTNQYGVKGVSCARPTPARAATFAQRERAEECVNCGRSDVVGDAAGVAHCSRESCREAAVQTASDLGYDIGEHAAEPESCWSCGRADVVADIGGFPHCSRASCREAALEVAAEVAAEAAAEAGV